MYLIEFQFDVYHEINERKRVNMIKYFSPMYIHRWIIIKCKISCEFTFNSYPHVECLFSLKIRRVENIYWYCVIIQNQIKKLIGFDTIVMKNFWICGWLALFCEVSQHIKNEFQIGTKTLDRFWINKIY